jgi:hypothetical protein
MSRFEPAFRVQVGNEFHLAPKNLSERQVIGYGIDHARQVIGGEQGGDPNLPGSRQATVAAQHPPGDKSDPSQEIAWGQRPLEIERADEESLTMKGINHADHHRASVCLCSPSPSEDLVVAGDIFVGAGVHQSALQRLDLDHHLGALLLVVGAPVVADTPDADVGDDGETLALQHGDHLVSDEEGHRRVEDRRHLLAVVEALAGPLQIVAA